MGHPKLKEKMKCIIVLSFKHNTRIITCSHNIIMVKYIDTHTRHVYVPTTRPVEGLRLVGHILP